MPSYLWGGGGRGALHTVTKGGKSETKNLGNIKVDTYVRISDWIPIFLVRFDKEKVSDYASSNYRAATYSSVRYHMKYNLSTVVAGIVVGVPYVPGDTTLFQASLLLLSSYYCCWRSLCSRCPYSVPGVPAIAGVPTVVVGVPFDPGDTTLFQASRLLLASLLLLLAFLMFQVTLLCSRRPCYCWRPYCCCWRSLCSRCPHSVTGGPAIAGVPTVVVGVPYFPGAPTLFQESLLLLTSQLFFCCSLCSRCPHSVPGVPAIAGLL